MNSSADISRRIEQGARILMGGATKEARQEAGVGSRQSRRKISMSNSEGLVHREQRMLHRLRRPRFSWTRIRGESDVQGGWENGSVEEREGTWVGTDEGSPEGDWSRCRRRGRGWSLGPGAAGLAGFPQTGAHRRRAGEHTS